MGISNAGCGGASRETLELLSVYTSAGAAPEAAGVVGPKLRLLVSPVLTCVVQTGFFWEPSLKVILWTSVVPALKAACFEQQSPQTMKSVAFSRLSAG
jgi:hypothetical protein